MPIAITDPRTGEVVRTYPEFTAAQIEEKLAAAAMAFPSYRLTSFDQRADWLRNAADLLDQRNDEIARLMSLEMGKTVAAARAEATKSAQGMRFYAENAAAFLADEPIDPASVGASKAYGRYLPLGVVLAIMPWNFPLWQAVRFAAPALMAGNVGLLKHASNVPGSALFLEQLFADAGFPQATFQTLLIGSGAVAGIIADGRVAAATLTGSEGAGVSVGRAAGESLKKVVLELGGSDAFIVMPSADISKSARIAVTARVQNNGQSCIAAKRFIIHEDIYDEWLAQFRAGFAALTLGDPAADGTDVGPLSTEAGRDEVAAQVRNAIAHGAVVEFGGNVPDRRGWWFEPTILTNITREMDMYHEEVFGPVAQVFRVADIDQAIEIANDTRFGLGSNAWTTDAQEQDRFIRDLVAGQTFINGMVTSFPGLPFGGVKNSGHGRELARAGIREFCNLKAVWIG
ncbi:NADP-dependent succinic semialdehyde dehydrogenase [Granulicoccus phenolivorans]|uniref:NADP-dependent succinic semialdehyde dehydrogenase n=1 Tax=Granulicoccus phenolivorans TaxID=266854 RepID=UPI0004264DCC|nr:NADP-dependent succinic semialdehyde dehydrogenase [Granulicoccus phenolivorans]